MFRVHSTLLYCVEEENVMRPIVMIERLMIAQLYLIHIYQVIFYLLHAENNETDFILSKEDGKKKLFWTMDEAEWVYFFSLSLFFTVCNLWHLICTMLPVIEYISSHNVMYFINLSLILFIFFFTLCMHIISSSASSSWALNIVLF